MNIMLVPTHNQNLNKYIQMQTPLTLIIIWFIITKPLDSTAQTFVTLGTDANNDVLCACTDLKQLSVAYNIAQDSVWFKIETHNARGAAYGYYIEIDWDNNSSNGSSWTGGGGATTCDGPANYPQMRDRGICVWPAYKFMEQWSSTGGTNVPGSIVNVRYPDAYTVIVNTKLSDVDNNSDGNFNVFASVGAQNYGYDMLDIMPASGFYNTAFVGVEKNILDKNEDIILADKQLLLSNSLQKSIQSISVFDITGKLVLEVKNPGSGSIDVSRLYENKGIYIYRIEKLNGEIISGKIGVF